MPISNKKDRVQLNLWVDSLCKAKFYELRKAYGCTSADTLQRILLGDSLDHSLDMVLRFVESRSIFSDLELNKLRRLKAVLDDTLST